MTREEATKLVMFYFDAISDLCIVPGELCIDYWELCIKKMDLCIEHLDLMKNLCRSFDKGRNNFLFCFATLSDVLQVPLVGPFYSF